MKNLRLNVNKMKMKNMKYNKSNVKNNGLEFKVIILFIIIIILTIFLVSNIYAQGTDISGIITQQGLQLLNLPPVLNTFVQATICVSSAGIGCIGSIIQGQVTSVVLGKVAEKSPQLGKIISAYNQIQPLINSGDANINSDLKLDANGNVIEGELELKNGKDTNINNFFNDLEDGKKVSATNLLVNKDKQYGITTLFFNKDDGKLTIGENVFENIAGDSSKGSFIKMNNKGSITEANFFTNNNGGDFNFNGIKINAPANSLVNFKAGILEPGKLTLTVPDGSTLSEIPSFEEGKFGNVELSSKVKSDGSAGSFILPDGTKVKGTLVYSDVIPEGYIPPLQTVVFNDQISVRALLQPIRLTSQIEYGKSNFHNILDKEGKIIKDYYTAHGNMNIQFAPGNKGNIEINLKKAGTYFSIGDDVKIDTWVESGGESKFYVGKKIYTYKGKDFFEGPFYSIFNSPIDISTSIKFYSIQDVNGELSYVPGKTVTIEGTQELKINSKRGTFNGEYTNVVNPIGASQNAPGGINNPGKSLTDGVPDTGTRSTTQDINNQRKPIETGNGVGVLFPKDIRYKVTSEFGMRYDPTTKTNKLHSGIDISVDKGTDIGSNSEGGVVVFAGFGNEKDHYNGYGKVVVIRDSNGIEHLYAHMSKISVEKGGIIKRGVKVGEVGNTGNVRGKTGIHLHYEVRKNGHAVNPHEYLP